MMDKGKLIVISGPDQSGKETQSKLLTEALDAYRFEFPDYEIDISGPILEGLLRSKETELRFPKDGVNKTQTFLLKKAALHPASFQLYQAINRINKNSVITSVLDAGCHVICDRYSIDAFIYGAVDGCPLNILEALNTVYLKPNLNIILLGKTFKRPDTEEDCNEKDTSFQGKVIEAYQPFNLARYEKYVGHIECLETFSSDSIIKSIHTTHVNVVFTVNKLLGLKAESLELDRITDILLKDTQNKSKLLKEENVLLKEACANKSRSTGS